MRYVHFAKICEKCGKVPNMRQSHIRVFLTCLTVIVLVSELSREVEMALTFKWQSVVGDEFDIVVSVQILHCISFF